MLNLQMRCQLLIQSVIGQVVITKSYYLGIGLGGGEFIYDASKAAINNGVFILNGWVRSIKDSKLSVHDAGAIGDGVTSDTEAINKLMQALYDLGLHSNGQLNEDSFEVNFEGNKRYLIDSQETNLFLQMA